MNCQRARSQISLWVGGDLDASAWECVREHLRECPSCQSYQVRMQKMLELLGSSDDSHDPAIENELSQDSLWPALSAQLAKRQRKRKRTDEFNGWVPALAMAAVCVVMVFAGSRPPQTVNDASWSWENRKVEAPAFHAASVRSQSEQFFEPGSSWSPAEAAPFEMGTWPDMAPNPRPEPRMIFIGE